MLQYLYEKSDRKKRTKTAIIQPSSVIFLKFCAVYFGQAKDCDKCAGEYEFHSV